MGESKCGCQTIGCHVTSCAHCHDGCECELTRIEVKPRANCASDRCDDTLCGSFSAK